MELREEVKKLLIETAKDLKGKAQRLRSALLHVEERVASQPRLLTMTFSQKHL